MAKRDFLFDGNRETTEAPNKAEEFMGAIAAAVAKACGDGGQCQTCLTPCDQRTGETLPAVVEHDKRVKKLLLAFDKAAGEVQKEIPDFGNSQAMSAGAVMVSVIARSHLNTHCGEVERMMFKLQTAAAHAQLDMALRVLEKQAIEGIPVILALARVLDTVIRKTSTPIAEELEAHNRKREEREKGESQ